MKKILLTGSAGFIFTNFLSFANKKKYEYEIVCVDKLCELINLKNINNNYKLYIGDITDIHFINNIFKIEKPNYIIHGAAQSFVDSSIESAIPFVHSNILGTQVLVNAALSYNVEKFIYISTDEVYGQLKNNQEPSWTEITQINPRNPYSASKASGEMIVKTAYEMHKLNYNITRCCNNYGIYQNWRNLVPKIIYCILNDQKIPIHGSGKQYREWIHADDHSEAIMHVLDCAPTNEIYNIGTGDECTNLEMVNYICKILKRGNELISFVPDRPGHDFRYSVNCSKIHSLGWGPKIKFNNGLETVVNWYAENQWYFKK